MDGEPITIRIVHTDSDEGYSGTGPCNTQFLSPSPPRKTHANTNGQEKLEGGAFGGDTRQANRIDTKNPKERQDDTVPKGGQTPHLVTRVFLIPPQPLKTNDSPPNSKNRRLPRLAKLSPQTPPTKLPALQLLFGKTKQPFSPSPGPSKYQAALKTSMRPSASSTAATTI